MQMVGRSFETVSPISQSVTAPEDNLILHCLDRVCLEGHTHPHTLTHKHTHAPPHPCTRTHTHTHTLTYTTPN
jgi:hypothetical protein